MEDVRPFGEAGLRVAKQCGSAPGWYMTMAPPELHVGEGAWAMPAQFRRDRRAFREFQVRPTDIWLLGFPRSGTTWSVEMVWLLANGGDTNAARKRGHWQRIHFLESSFYIGVDCSSHLEKLNNMPHGERRFIKSHLPLELLPRNVLDVADKVVYISRDPRDVTMSIFHNYRTLGKYSGSLDDFLDAVVADEVLYAPVVKHSMDFRRLDAKQNLLLLTYEELKQDLRSALRRVARFLDVEVVAEDALLEHLSFGAMKANPAVNMQGLMGAQCHGDDAFIRRGQTGAWRADLDETQAARLNAWLKGSSTLSDRVRSRM